MEIKPEPIKLPSADTILKNTSLAIEFYHLGPANPQSVNEVYWAKMAKMWRTSIQDAKCRRCANCEYYNNSEPMMKAMLSIPINEHDLFDGQAQRGYCHRLDFICHTSRSCSVWESKDFELED